MLRPKLTEEKLKFLSKIEDNEDTECWLWCNTKEGKYGLFSYGGKQTTAHRKSYLLFIGDIADGMEVCHKCDNPRCVNPDHLFLGTHSDNMRDKMMKGRGRGPSKITNVILIDIITMVESNCSNREITTKYLPIFAKGYMDFIINTYKRMKLVCDITLKK